MATLLEFRGSEKEEAKKKRTFMVSGGVPFELDIKYAPYAVLGSGSFGLVCACINLQTNEHVAVKKIVNALCDGPTAVMSLREIQILRRVGLHDNIVSLKDVMLSSPLKHSFRHVYVVQELMDYDLGRVIKEGKLSADHVKYLMFQILKGLYFLHSANIIHRDLKPRNILVDKASRVKICDFGLARSKREDPQNMTAFVGTRWYMAPEFLNRASWYGNGVDIWSAGCVLAEMLGGAPIFPVDDPLGQITRIFHVLGTPSDLNFVESERSRKYLEALPYSQGEDFQRLYPSADPQALDLLKMMLVVDPSDRASASQALQHPYFSGIYDPDRDTPLTKVKINLEVDEYAARGVDEKIVRDLIWEEMLFYHPEERTA